MSSHRRFSSPEQAANDSRILLFGRLLGSANRLDFLLGKALEESIGVTHSAYELLLLIGRAGADGLAVRDIAQARVLTSGGATRLVQRAVTDGLVTRRPSPDDARVQLVSLTPHGEDVLLRASEIHVANIERYMIDVLAPEQVDVLAVALRTLSLSASRALPVMP